MINIIGGDPFHGELTNVYIKKGIKILDKKVTLNFVENLEDIENCSILYIAEDVNDRFNEIIEAVENKSILVISDTKGYAKRGAHISFYITNDNRLHYEINKEKATKSKVKINSRLLRIAKLV